jgi:hypothetical protein
MSHSKTPRTKGQSQLFIDKARELGCDEDPRSFERTFSKIVPPKTSAPPKPEKKTTRTKR